MVCACNVLYICIMNVHMIKTFNDNHIILRVCVCVCVCAHTRVLLEQDHRGPWTREGVNVLRLEGLPGVESS